MSSRLQPIPGLDGYHAGTDGGVYSTVATARPRRLRRELVFVGGRGGVARMDRELVARAFVGRRPSPLFTAKLIDPCGDCTPDNVEWRRHFKSLARRSASVEASRRVGSRPKPGAMNPNARLDESLVRLVLQHRRRLCTRAIAELTGLQRRYVYRIVFRHLWATLSVEPLPPLPFPVELNGVAVAAIKGYPGMAASLDGQRVFYFAATAEPGNFDYSSHRVKARTGNGFIFRVGGRRVLRRPADVVGMLADRG
jgi:hypothetical protein